MQPESKLQFQEIDSENEILREEEKLVFTVIEKYEDIIKALEQQNEHYQVKLEECTNSVHVIANENANLILEYKQSLESQISALENDELFVPQDTCEYITDLQHQTELLKQEKEQILQAWQLALREIERLEQRSEDENYQPHVAVSRLEQKSSQMKDEYVKIISELNLNIDKLKEDNKKYQTDLHVKNIQITEMRTMLQSMKDQSIAKEKQIEEMSRKESALKEQIHILQNTLSSLQLKSAESLRETIELRENYVTLQEQTTTLIKKNTNLEMRERDLIKQMKESLQMAEDAVLEKDEGNMKIQHQQTEIQRLKDALGQLVDEAGLRTKKEVDSVHKTYASRISRLEKEIESLELKNGELQTDLDKAMREKNSAETNLRKLQQGSESEDLQQSFQQIHTRLIQAERKTNDVFAELEATKIKMKLLEISHKKEAERWDIEKHHLIENVKWLEKECETHLESKVQLTCEVERYQTQIQQLKQQIEAAKAKTAEQTTAFENEKSNLEQKWKAKLTNLEDYYQNMCQELRQLLTAQQKLSVKWKSEMKLATQTWENRMSDTHMELLHYKKRNMELSSILNEKLNRSSHSRRVISVPNCNLEPRKDKRTNEKKVT